MRHQLSLGKSALFYKDKIIVSMGKGPRTDAILYHSGTIFASSHRAYPLLAVGINAKECVAQM